MAYGPPFETFCQLAAGVARVPVFRRLLSDSLTPVMAFARLDSAGGACSCLFESVVGGEKVGRYSFLATDPYLLIEADGRHVRITRPATAAAAEQSETFDCDDPLAELKRRIDQFPVAKLADLPPFCGGAVGYAGYDTVRYTERLPNPPPDDRHLPDLAFGLFDHMVVFDNVTKTLTVVILADVSGGPAEHRQAYERACRRADELAARLQTPSQALTLTDIDSGGDPQGAYESNFTQAEFEQVVERSKEYIRAGDIFQVVLSQRLCAPITAPPLEIYRTLRVVNPSPFMFYLRLPRVTLVGSSPEVMVRVVDGQVTVRPLAGTRRRGLTEEHDRQLAEELLADPKERAEHVMLVDLGRNDVGRVARYGTVELTDVMTIERYSHVMHITSNVTGHLADGKDAFDALRACLPAGTVSGAPKVRAMEIIDEFERHRRGPYAGAVGYIDFSGNMDTCIALRTIVVQNNKAYVQAGAGIVADSDPTAEYHETLNKARGLLRAIELTEQRLAAGRSDRGPC